MADHARWQRSIVDGSGNVVPNVNIEVLRLIAGTPLAQLYSDRAGSDPIGNPFVATTGFAAFHVRGGAYRIRAYITGFERIWDYVGIGTLQEMDLTTLLAQAIGLNWIGEWVTATEYEVAQGVENDGSSYRCKADHTAGSTNEPGVGEDWENFWDLIAAKGDQGDPGGEGDPGAPGAAATIAIGTVTTVGPEDPATVTNVGTGAAAVLDFEIPQGEDCGGAGSGNVISPATAVTDGHAVVWDGAGGTDVKTAGGPPVLGDYGSDANVRAATTGNHALKAAHLESAAAPVTLTETGGAIAVDWDTFINGESTIDQATVISNPTNGQPGTWRSIIVQGNDSTDRTITFGTQFGGELPVITDCDNAKWYELIIRCVTATHFLVSARDASPP